MNLKLWFSGIRIKLLLLSFIPVLFLISSTILSMNGLKRLEGDLEKANLVRGPLITHSGEMLLFSTSVARWSVTAMWNFQDMTERTNALKNVKMNIEDFDRVMKEYLNLPRSAKAKEIFKNVESTWPELKNKIDELIPLIDSGSPENIELARKSYIKEVRPRVGIVINTIQELNATRKVIMEEELKEEEEFINNLDNVMLFGSIFAVLLTIVLMVSILKHILSNLDQVTTNLTSASYALASASEQLSSSSTEVAAGSAETASAIQETVSSLEEITSMVKTTDSSSQISLGLTEETQKQAQQSEVKLGELLVSLREISSSSDKITDIIQVIDDISFQTNLLALNAAVEAARAGEQGRGFAVVAEAVRALAQKSATSAKEIGGLINESVEKTKKGVGIGSECKELMGKMFDSLKKVSGKSHEIAQSSREQSTGMEQISKAMNQLDRATQQNSAASEQISSASNELSAQASTLNQTVEGLKTLVYGQKGESELTKGPDPSEQSNWNKKKTQVSEFDRELPRVG